MALEIERKFLVNLEAWNDQQPITTSSMDYYQGYLLTAAHTTIRVRTAGPHAWITIKGPTEGASRLEYEYPIPLQDAQEMLQHFAAAVVCKTRHVIHYGGKCWEVDIFRGENEGLIVAEIELQHEEETFALPPWVDREVTGEEKYYNSRLSEHPYKEWGEG